MLKHNVPRKMRRKLVHLQKPARWGRPARQVGEPPRIAARRSAPRQIVVRDVTNRVLPVGQPVRAMMAVAGVGDVRGLQRRRDDQEVAGEQYTAAGSE